MPETSLPASANAASDAAATVDCPAWHAFAQAIGARLEPDAWGLQACFGPTSASAIAAGFIAALPDLGLLTVSGNDARSFLHSQLTNDVEQLGAQEARWYGYCSAKGRLLGSFLGWSEADGLALVLSQPTAEAVRKRLSMFVLRAKVKVVDASQTRLLFGLGGEAARAALAWIGFVAPPLAMASATVQDLSLVGLPEVMVDGKPLARWLLTVPADRATEIWQSLVESPAGGLQPVSSPAWRWTEVLAGVPRIIPCTVEKFVPQVLNLDLSGAVSFTKGCYPGQEVVARMHYLGKQRRRMFLGQIATVQEPAPGSEVLDAAGGLAGQVVLAAPIPGDGTQLLFEAQIAAVADGPLQIAGMTITIGSLPYLPAE